MNARSYNYRKIFIEIITSIFILLFVYTAVSKIAKFEEFDNVLKASPLIGSLHYVIALSIPISELIISALLFFPKTRRIGLYSTLILMSTFTIYLGYMIVFTPDKPCNCGGIISSLSWTQHLILNLLLTISSFLAIRFLKKTANEDHNVSNKISLTQ